MNHDFFHQVRQTTRLIKISRQQVRQLQAILSKQHKRKVSIKEANEVSKDLVSFYDLLAGNKKIVEKNKDRAA